MQQLFEAVLIEWQQQYLEAAAPTIPWGTYGSAEGCGNQCSDTDVRGIPDPPDCFPSFLHSGSSTQASRSQSATRVAARGTDDRWGA